jgi:hypothetical protein
MDAPATRKTKGVSWVGALRILGPDGDSTYTWDPAVDADVDEVRRRFDEIIDQGYLVFELDPGTREGRQVRTFDPRAVQLRAFRPMVGG